MQPNQTKPNPDHKTMESNNASASSCSSATNWTVSGGSLADTVTFESSISPIDDDQTAVPSISRSPLILSPPSSDSSPCEVTLAFTQKHEIRQVYVRSSARVYEIYYAPQQHGTNEYLCTVRCVIAAKDESEAVSPQLKGSSGDPAEGNLKSDSNLSTSEDEWIDVKALDTPQLDNRRVSLPSKTDTNPGRSTQEFYEATAEIADADPCTSLTLRLLSLQTMGCVYIDEIYVFADPVDPADSENQVGPVDSAGSSLMAMFMPTLMQLSKTRSVGGIHDQQTWNMREKLRVSEFRSEASDSTTQVGTKMQQDEKSNVVDITNTTAKLQQDGKPWTNDQQVRSQEVSTAAVGPAQIHSPSQFPNAQNKPDFPLKDRIEIVLDQLVSRVGKIEELCFKFQENMLKPISGIEKRLQRVEEQLEVLTKRTENSGLCTRFFAPEFSCNDSDSNLNSSYMKCGTFESEEKDIPLELSVHPDDVHDVQLLPGLVVTAPEFCNGDDEEENHASEPVTDPESCNVDYEEENTPEPASDSPKDKPKQTLSIDDALASALIGFLSSTSIQPAKYTQTLAIKAPEFSSEDGADGSGDKEVSHVQCETARDSSGCFDKSDGTDYIGTIVSPVCFEEIESTDCAKSTGSCASNTSLESEGNVTASHNVDCSVADGVNMQCQHDEDGEGNFPDARFEITELAGINIEDAAVSNAISIGLIPNEKDVLNQILQNQEDVSSDINNDDDVGSIHCTDKEVTEGSDKDILQSVIKFSQAPSMVDFESPILDVKFISQESFTTKSPLEALSGDMPESIAQAYVVEEVEDGCPSSEQCSLITVEDGEILGHASDNQFLVDMNYFKSGDVPKNMEGETFKEKYASGDQEQQFSLI